jgi:hypothetical protein
MAASPPIGGPARNTHRTSRARPQCAWAEAWRLSPFMAFRKPVEQAPRGPGRKGLVHRLAPLAQHRQHGAAANHADVQGANEQIMRIPVDNLCSL